jgi:NhaA family Na+:H+ antiporter
MKQEVAAGLLLATAAILAIFLANSNASLSWQSLLDMPLALPLAHELGSPRLLIGQALMVIFFFTVGLELKREVTIGQLARADQRRLPFVAAAAGMVIPALIYRGLTYHHADLARGWAIPTATDIAFVLGVMAMLGRSVPRDLRMFLLTLAVVDDMGAVLVIALGYTAHVDLGWLGAGAGVLAAMMAMNRAGLRQVAPYGILAVALWLCVLQSGVHATIAGVLAAFTVPLAAGHRDSPLLRLEHRLAPWSGLVIVPLFALAHAGVELSGGFGAPTLAIGAGLWLGKPLGIFGAIWASEKLGFARRPAGTNWLQILGAAQLAGIGFTMSLFIGTLAFPGEPLRANAIRMGILGGSALAAALGAGLLWLGGRRDSPPA